MHRAERHADAREGVVGLPEELRLVEELHVPRLPCQPALLPGAMLNSFGSALERQ